MDVLRHSLISKVSMLTPNDQLQRDATAATPLLRLRWKLRLGVC
jgi:hypothetical protein